MAERRSTLEALEINDPAFYQGRRVFVTGHTGFKGAWLCAILAMAGAEVTGFALPPAEESLWTLAGLERHVRSVYGEEKSMWTLKKEVRETYVRELMVIKSGNGRKAIRKTSLKSTN